MTPLNTSSSIPQGPFRRSLQKKRWGTSCWWQQAVPLGVVFWILHSTGHSLQNSIEIYNTDINILSPSTTTLELAKNNNNIRTRMIDSMSNRSQASEVPKDMMSRAIVAIAMGTEAIASQIVERFVWSAVHRGKWKGPIILLTDAPVDRYENLVKWTQNFVALRPPTQDYSQQHEWTEMARKRFKTYVLEYLDNMEPETLGNVETVYYLDVDIVFAQPVLPMMQDIEYRYRIGTRNNDPSSSGHNATTSAHMWMFRGNTDRWAIQGGQMILDRATSQPCLDRWRYHMDHNLAERKDQVLLNIMMNENYPHCQIIPMEQDGYIEFPEKKEIVSIAKQVYLAAQQEQQEQPQTPNATQPTTTRRYSPLVHIRNTAEIRKVKKSNWQLFVQDVLGMDERAGQHAITKKMLF